MDLKRRAADADADTGAAARRDFRVIYVTGFSHLTLATPFNEPMLLRRVRNVLGAAR